MWARSAVVIAVSVAAGDARDPVRTVASVRALAIAVTSALPRALPGPATSSALVGALEGSMVRRVACQLVADGATVTGRPAQPTSADHGTVTRISVGTTTRSRSPTSGSNGSRIAA